MPEMGTSGLMSGDGKRGGAVAPVLAPILDSTQSCRCHPVSAGAFCWYSTASRRSDAPCGRPGSSPGRWIDQIVRLPIGESPLVDGDRKSTRLNSSHLG